MKHATVTRVHVWETGLFGKPVCTQMKDACRKDLSGCKLGNRIGNQPFVLILEQSDLIW